MIRIEESRVYAYITCDTSDEEYELRLCLKFVKKVKSYTRRPLTVTTKLYHVHGNQTLIFRGLVPYLEQRLTKAEMPYTVHYSDIAMPKPEEEDYLENIKDLRPYQVEALDAAIEYSGGILWLATNAGKTEVAASLIKMYPGMRFLYLVTGSELFEQTVSRFEKKGIDVGMLNTQWQDLNRQTVVAMAQTLNARINKLGEFLSGIDAIIWDECQHAGGKTAETIFSKCTSAIFKLGLTGTVPSDLVRKLTIQQFFGPVSYRVPNEYLIEHSYSSGIRINIIKGDWSNTGVGEETQKLVMLERQGLKINLWQEVCTMGIIKNEDRNNAILAVLEKILSKNGIGILIFVDYIEHGQILSELLHAPFVYSNSTDRDELFQQFKSGILKVLITSPILDEGIDISGIHHIIFASGRKSEVKLLQRIGRGLRRAENKDFLTLYDFYDEETNMLKKHTERRLEIYKKEGFSIEFKELSSVLGLL